MNVMMEKDKKTCSVGNEAGERGWRPELIADDKQGTDITVESAVKSVLKSILYNNDSQIPFAQRVALLKEITDIHVLSDVSPRARHGYYEAISEFRNRLYDIERNL